MDARLAQFLFFQEVLYKIDSTENLEENNSNFVEFDAKQETLVICNTLTDAETELLEKILFAVKLSFSTIDLLRYNNTPMISFDKLIKNNVTQKIINFGVDIPQLEEYFMPKLYVTQQAKSLIYLQAESLSSINNNSDSKKKLWSNLKTMF